MWEMAERVNLAVPLDSTIRLLVQRHGLNEYHRAPRRIPISTSSSSSTSGFYDIWEADFVYADKMRVVGWAFCYQHPPTADSRTTWSRREVGNNVMKIGVESRETNGLKWK
jgi:hypothetical protein